MQKKKFGFSYIEALIMIIILGLVVLLSLPIIDAKVKNKIASTSGVPAVFEYICGGGGKVACDSYGDGFPSDGIYILDVEQNSNLAKSFIGEERKTIFAPRLNSSVLMGLVGAYSVFVQSLSNKLPSYCTQYIRDHQSDYEKFSYYAPCFPTSTNSVTEGYALYGWTGMTSILNYLNSSYSVKVHSIRVLRPQ